MIVVIGVGILEWVKKGEFAIHLTFLVSGLVNKVNSTYLALQTVFPLNSRLSKQVKHTCTFLPIVYEEYR